LNLHSFNTRLFFVKSDEDSASIIVGRAAFIFGKIFSKPRMMLKNTVRVAVDRLDLPGN